MTILPWRFTLLLLPITFYKYISRGEQKYTFNDPFACEDKNTHLMIIYFYTNNLSSTLSM